MSIRWTQKALADLDSIFETIALDRPSVAESVIRTLLTHGEGLIHHPHRGRSGRVPNTRELVTPHLPYIIVYRLTPSFTSLKSDAIILRVVHGAMQWPHKSQP